MPKLQRKKEEGNNGSPAWMVTFSDLMTLLLVFFVLLYSFSVMDIEKFEGFMSAFQAQLGVLDGGKTINDESLVARGNIAQRFNPSLQNFNKVMGEMSTYIEQEGLNDRVEMELTERGLVVRLTGQVLYDVGKAELKVGGKNLLDEIAKLLKDIPNDIMVEGHTDNWPINNEDFPSNWELSTTRATNVVRYFMENTEIEPSRLMAAGYSEYRPLFENDTVEHRAKNRRIEIVILNTLHNTDLEGR
ncbi:flagellar motor protein MotB [Halocella sp. SP3-1]|uniref:flagellar motor protein MotB n=1 Tax=Halocella sp. SP3-1 TaxID=2382161 RepID=UPI000F74C1E2|nr:flagellar motor protein MotB [Halocella sp. SP3-1]AZO94048.1 flagellar motor protein MotB [Halocella sp. SP3-1]